MGFFVGLGLLIAVFPALARHCVGFTQYDASKSMTLHGVVTKVEVTNPHAHFYVDVRDENGNVTNWNMELASPNALRRLGWTRDIIKVAMTSAYLALPPKTVPRKWPMPERLRSPTAERWWPDWAAESEKELGAMKRILRQCFRSRLF